MNELKALLAKAAPWLAAATAGPAGLAAQAIKTAAQALGASESLQGVTAALTGASAEQLGDLKVAEQGFQERMQALGFSNLQAMEALAAADRSDAREMQTDKPSSVPALLTCFIVGAFTTTLVLLLKFDVPVVNRDIVVYMIGQLSGGFASALAFWLGTTRNSSDKDKTLAKVVAGEK